MLAGIATPVQAAAQVKAVLNPGNLETNYPLPRTGRSEPAFTPTAYWRGPTWTNVDWLALLGIEGYGLHAVAKQLKEATVRVVIKNASPREHYNPLTGDGQGAMNYMWTGAVYVVIVNDLAGRTRSADALHSVIKPPPVSGGGSISQEIA